MWWRRSSAAIWSRIQFYTRASEHSSARFPDQSSRVWVQPNSSLLLLIPLLCWMFPPYILHIWWEGPARRRSYRCKEASRITPPPHRGHGGLCPLLQAAGFERCRAPRHQVAGALRQGAPVPCAAARRSGESRWEGCLRGRGVFPFLFLFFFQKFTVTKHNVIIGELCIQLFFFYISFDFFFFAQVIYIAFI